MVVNEADDDTVSSEFSILRYLKHLCFLRLMFGRKCFCRVDYRMHILSHQGDTDEVNSGTWQAWNV